MFAPASKKALLAVLVGCFVVQTGLVYSDDVDITLSAEAVQGRKLFHRYSCQVCHQLWGQGGFLGPDLTNAGSRIDESRITSLLTVGSGQMPAMHLPEPEIAALGAFLVEIDRPDIGRGQLRLGDPSGATSPQASFEAAVEAAAPTSDVAAGFETFRSGICSACHFPFQTSTVGAPDLSTVVERLAEDELREVLTSGRPDRGMPPPEPAFDEGQIDRLVAYFRWLNTNRATLSEDAERRRAERAVDWSKLPWWEYE